MASNLPNHRHYPMDCQFSRSKANTPQPLGLVWLPLVNFPRPHLWGGHWAPRHTHGFQLVKPLGSGGFSIFFPMGFVIHCTTWCFKSWLSGTTFHYGDCSDNFGKQSTMSSALPHASPIQSLQSQHTAYLGFGLAVFGVIFQAPHLWVGIGHPGTPMVSKC